MHVALLFPPVVDPRSPHLAIPSLAAALRAASVRVTVRDLNLEGFWALTEPGVVAAAGDDYLAGHVVAARDALRDPDAFYDPNRHHAARMCLAAACNVVSAASQRVEYQALGARYDIDGVDTARLDDLLAVTADPSVNLFHDLWTEELMPSLVADRPDLVGISILNRQQIAPGLTLARMLRDAGHRVVIGGTVYAKFVPQLMRRPTFFEVFCDALVPYEGETALLELVAAACEGRPFVDLPNVLTLSRAGTVVAGPNHIEDMASLPTPDFGGLPLDRYLMPAPVLPILTGKGCYFNRCKFCDIPAINRISPRPYRMRPPEVVAADVATLHRRYGARHFEITDETLSPSFLLRLGSALEPHGAIEPRFVGYARLEPGFSPETCERLHAMGVRKLFFGLESGSQATLDHMDKGIRLPVARQTLRNCRDAKIAVHVFSIVGFPEETRAAASETVDFFVDEVEALSGPEHSFDVHPFGLDLRTDYFDDAARYGVQIDEISLGRRDFPISVDAWTNSRGLDPDGVQTVLTEAHTRLRQHYAGSGRQYPDQQWPGFEEYAVLYGDRYDGASFGFRLTLPPPGSPQAFALIWAESVVVRPSGTGSWLVRCVTGTIEIDDRLLRVLATPGPPQPVDDLLAALGGHPDLRFLIDQLLAARVLWLIPWAPVPGQAGPSRVRFARS